MLKKMKVRGSLVELVHPNDVFIDGVYGSKFTVEELEEVQKGLLQRNVDYRMLTLTESVRAQPCVDALGVDLFASKVSVSKVAGRRLCVVCAEVDRSEGKVNSYVDVKFLLSHMAAHQHFHRNLISPRMPCGFCCDNEASKCDLELVHTTSMFRVIVKCFNKADDKFHDPLTYTLGNARKVSKSNPGTNLCLPCPECRRLASAKQKTAGGPVDKNLVMIWKYNMAEHFRTAHEGVALPSACEILKVTQKSNHGPPVTLALDAEEVKGLKTLVAKLRVKFQVPQ